jgi:hypothetical protein
MFSAIWLSREETKRERWEDLALPKFLGRIYYPYLGEGKGRVVDAKTKKPIGNALVTVNRLVGGKLLLTTRKLTDERGTYSFGGWAGNDKNDRVDYEITIESDSFRPKTIRVRLRADERVTFDEARLSR